MDREIGAQVNIHLHKQTYTNRQIDRQGDRGIQARR